MDIGETEEVIVVEPLEDPFEVPTPEPEKAPVAPEPEREKVPA